MHLVEIFLPKYDATGSEFPHGSTLARATNYWNGSAG